MEYTEWLEATNTHDMAVEMGYECWGDVPLQTRLLILHGLSEAWINYKFLAAE